jgi:hypothetical protein
MMSSPFDDVEFWRASLADSARSSYETIEHGRRDDIMLKRASPATDDRADFMYNPAALST